MGEKSTYDPDNRHVEIKKIRSSIFDFNKDKDIREFRYGSGRVKSLTWRAWITRDGKPSILGWKLIRLALMGKSWRYLSRHTGIDKKTIAFLFRNNPVIRTAVVELEEQVIEDSKAMLVRALRRTTRNLIKIATGQITGLSADKIKVQLEAIREHYNRVGFGLLPKGKGEGSDLTIRIESGEAKALGILIDRREHKLLGGGEHDGEAEDEAKRGSEVEPDGDGSVAGVRAGGEEEEAGFIEGKVIDQDS